MRSMSGLHSERDQVLGRACRRCGWDPCAPRLRSPRSSFSRATVAQASAATAGGTCRGGRPQTGASVLFICHSMTVRSRTSRGAEPTSDGGRAAGPLEHGPDRRSGGAPHARAAPAARERGHLGLVAPAASPRCRSGSRAVRARHGTRRAPRAPERVRRSERGDASDAEPAWTAVATSSPGAGTGMPLPQFGRLCSSTESGNPGHSSGHRWWAHRGSRPHGPPGIRPEQGGLSCRSVVGQQVQVAEAAQTRAGIIEATSAPLWMTSGPSHASRERVRAGDEGEMHTRAFISSVISEPISRPLARRRRASSSSTRWSRSASSCSRPLDRRSTLIPHVNTAPAFRFDAPATTPPKPPTPANIATTDSGSSTPRRPDSCPARSADQRFARAVPG